MRMWNEFEETAELLNELENNEVYYTLAEHGKIFVDVFDDDELVGIWKIKYEPYWGAFKMVWFYQDNNEIKEAKTVAWGTEQVIENVLAD